MLFSFPVPLVFILPKYCKTLLKCFLNLGEYRKVANLLEFGASSAAVVVLHLKF